MIALPFLIISLSLLFIPTLTRSTPTEVRGELSEVGNVSIEYSRPQSSGISPACGCVADQVYQDWRGITAVAKYIELDRKGTNPTSVFHITGAYPTNVSWRPSEFQFRARIYRIDLDGLARFDPNAVVSRKFPPRWKVREVRTGDATGLLSVRTQRPLRVAALGPKPIAAWIPMRGSKVHLRSSKGLHADSMRTAEISEEYASCTNGVRDEEEYPMLDVLGPNVLFWSDDPDMQLTNGREFLDLGSPAPAAGRQLTVIHIESPPFAARVAVQGWDEQTWNQYSAAVRKRTLESKLLVGSNCQDSGTAFARILDPEQQAAEYASIRREIAMGSVVILRNIPSHSGSLGFMTFRYPPIPETVGFGIFGDISSIAMDSAVGKIWTGSKLVESPIPSELEFKGMTGFRTTAGAMTMPISAPDSTGRAVVRVERAIAEVFLNKQSLTTRSDFLRPYADAMGAYNLVLAALSLVAAVLALVVPLIQNAHGK